MIHEGNKPTMVRVHKENKQMMVHKGNKPTMKIGKYIL